MAEITTTQQTTNTQANSCGCNTTPPDYVPTWPGCPPPPYPPFCPPPSDNCGTSNKTEYYGLPLWKASDVTSWLMQMNGAMIRIDSIMHNIALRTGINGIPEDLTNTVSQLCNEFNQLKVQLCEVTNDVATQKLNILNLTQQINNMQTDLSSMSLTATNLNTRMLTLETTQQNQANSVTLLQTDVNMMSKTINALQSALTQLQNSVNASITELQSGIKEVQNELPNFLDTTKDVVEYISDTQFKAEADTGNTDVYTIKEITTAGLYKLIDGKLLTMRLPSFTATYTGTSENNMQWLRCTISSSVVNSILEANWFMSATMLFLINGSIVRGSVSADTTRRYLVINIDVPAITPHVTGDFSVIPISLYTTWLGNSSDTKQSSEDVQSFLNNMGVQ